MKQFTSLLLALTLALGLTACSAQPGTTGSQDASLPQTGDDSLTSAFPVDDNTYSDYYEGITSIYEDTLDYEPTVEEGEYYYDLENVVLYLDAYGELPDNYITKDEARELGWEGGSVEEYLEGGAIGGDRFGNREGYLPDFQGRIYTECDLNTDGKDSRGAERLVFSSDGLYFYTEDHYETFVEVWVEQGEVMW